MMDGGESNNKVTINLSGIFSILLTIAFIVLKLCKVIDWAWIWVLAPLWIDFAIALVVLIIVVIVAWIRKDKF